MKIQGLAIVAVMILLPLMLVLGRYIETMTQTLQLQISYDTKLRNSTYDALKAFQLNSSNSDTSDIVSSKMRDIKAGANSFFNSLASNFNMPGYDKETLSAYVPAVVFTMYDGYYIYGPFTNTLDSTNTNNIHGNVGYSPSDQRSDAEILNKRDCENKDEYTYYNEQELSNLKPYVYYSCRYKKGTNIDVTITYTLDNYITVQGIGLTGPINESGYLISNVQFDGDPNAETVPKDKKGKLRGTEITYDTNYKENVYLSGSELTDTGGDYRIYFWYLSISL